MSAEVMSGGGGSPKLQDKIITPSTSSQIVTPDSNYDGLSKVIVNAMPTGVLNNPTINSNGLITANVGTSGYLSSGTNKTLQLSTQGSKTITPGRYNQTAVDSGKYTTGAIRVSGDSNLIASNIKSGVNIFGVTGTYKGKSYVLYENSYNISKDTVIKDFSNEYCDIFMPNLPKNAKIIGTCITLALYSDSDNTFCSVGITDIETGSVIFNSDTKVEIEGTIKSYAGYLRINGPFGDLSWDGNVNKIEIFNNNEYVNVVCLI